MPLPVWIALVLLLVAAIVGPIYVFFRARRFLRIARIVSADFDGPVRRLEASVELLSAKAEGAEARSAKLEERVARLRRSLARLEVLRGALQEVSETFNEFAAVYPRK
jgi:sigma54-dependent transcription regulator